MWTDKDLRNRMLFNTQQYFTATFPFPSGGNIKRGGRDASQIKLIQAVDILLPEHSGQQKYSSPPKEGSLAQKFSSWKEITQEGCVCMGSPPF